MQKEKIKRKSIGDLLNIDNIGKRKRNKSTTGLKRGQSIEENQDQDSNSNSGSRPGMTESWGHSSQSSLTSKSHSSNGSRSRSISNKSATSSQNQEKGVIKLLDNMQIEPEQVMKQQYDVQAVLQQAGLIQQQGGTYTIFRTASRISQQSQFNHHDVFQCNFHRNIADDSEIQIRFLPPLSMGQFENLESHQKHQFHFE